MNRIIHLNFLNSIKFLTRKLSSLFSLSVSFLLLLSHFFQHMRCRSFSNSSNHCPNELSHQSMHNTQWQIYRHLARNPFICDCNLRWLAEYLHKNPIETSGARCDAPKRMHRRRIEALRDEKFKCEFNFSAQCTESISLLFFSLRFFLCFFFSPDLSYQLCVA